MKVLYSVTVAACLLLISKYGFTQEINWVGNLTWEQVKSKARAENKPIFIDCMATWCVPCKEMDHEVYNQKSVADMVNKDFIAVKLQMDSTARDNAEVRLWYVTARKMGERYGVNAYPSYLFFSPEGNLVFRDKGAKNLEHFSEMLKIADEKGRTYGEDLKAWFGGDKNYDKLAELIFYSAIHLNDHTMAEQLGREGINYLSEKTGNDIYHKELLLKVHGYLKSSYKKIFSLFYPEANGKVTDSILGQRGVSTKIAAAVIGRDIQDLLVTKGDWKKPMVTKPDWKKIKVSILKKFPEFDGTDKLMAEAKRNWYWFSEPDIDEWARLTIDYHNRYADFENTTRWGKDNVSIAPGVNDDMWYRVFAKVTDREILLLAANLQLRLVNAMLAAEPTESPGDIDTYANLLYKAGKVEEAIKWQERAVGLRKEKEAKRGDKKPYLGFVNTLEKMKKGEPTWLNVR